MVAAYLNPALIAAVLSAAARGHEQAGEPMLWPVAYLTAPLVLHRPTRQALPGNVRTHLSTWVARDPLLRAGFPYRAASLAAPVREGLRFGVRHGILTLDAGHLSGRVDRGAGDQGELRELLSSASLVGRWLSHTRPATAFALLGVAV